jgi:hypothetical protein
MHLVSSSSALLILAASVSAAAELASNFTLVPATECKFPFMYNKVHYYGCTTAGNPTGDNRPWCVLKDAASRAKQDWRFCDQTAVGTVKTLTTDTNKQCIQTGWQKVPGTPNELVFGCAKGESDKDFTCILTGGKTVTCTNLTPTYASQNGLMAVIAGLNGDGAGGKNVATIIGASIGGALLVALLAGLVIVRRRKSDASKGAQNGAGGGGPGGQWDYKHSGMDAPNDYGGGGMTGVNNPGLLDSAPAGKVYAVISTYTPTLGDELEIQPGDKVSVLVEYDDGWCQGVNHTRGGLKGVFPKHCIDLAS